MPSLQSGLVDEYYFSTANDKLDVAIETSLHVTVQRKSCCDHKKKKYIFPGNSILGVDIV